MKKFAAAVVCIVIALSGCGNADETYRPAGYADELSESPGLDDPLEKPEPAEPKPSAAQTSASAQSSGGVSEQSRTSSAYSYSIPPGEIPDITQELDAHGDTTRLTLYNVYAQGEFYSVTASAEQTAGRTALTLALSQSGQTLQTLNIYVPDGERFVLLENAEDNSSYGCEMLSNLREFGAAEYPDLIGLIFRGSNTEAAVPEYARYFAVFGGRLSELPIYEDGRRTAPRGAKLEPKSAGVAVQHLTVLRSSGEGYEIIKFEYRFDLENRRLDKRRVKFYGWDI